MTPVEHRLNGPLGEIFWFEWGQAGEGPTLLLLHATGFHARVWDQVIAHLPKDIHVVAPDNLGHGRSHKPDIMGDWSESCQSLLPLVDHLLAQGGGRPLIACGHSMGGYVLAMLAAERPEAFQDIVLIDPVIFQPSHYEGQASVVGDPNDHPVSKRRNQWDSPEQMQAHFSQRKPYATWQSDVLADYCQYGLLPADGAGDGEGQGFVLACSPRLEASIYQNAEFNSPYERADQIQANVTVLRGRVTERAGPLDFSSSPTWPGVAAQLNHGRDLQWSEYSHFIPMEAPDKVADLLNSLFVQDETPLK